MAQFIPQTANAGLGGPQHAAVHNGHIAVHLLPHDVRDPVAGGRLLRPHQFAHRAQAPTVTLMLIGPDAAIGGHRHYSCLVTSSSRARRQISLFSFASKCWG
jgi:hypothetical protein